MNPQLAQALAAHRAGQFDVADRAYAAVLAAEPELADAWHMYGLLRHQQGRHDEAEAHIVRALTVGATGAMVWANLAAVRLAAGHHAQAAEAARQAVTLDPNHFGAWLNLGLALEALRDWSGAERALESALRLRRDEPRAFAAFGRVLEIHHGPAAAIAPYRAWHQLTPGQPEAEFHLGRALYHAEQPTEACAALRACIAREGAPRDAHLLFAAALLDLGEVEEALEAYRVLLAQAPDFAAARSNALIAMQLAPEVSARALFEAHGDWARRHAPEALPLPRATRASGRIRLGFVSPRFHEGPVASFLLPLLDAIDRANFEIHLYATNAFADPMTARFVAAADTWHEVALLDDAALRERLIADGIDVAFDLAGHAPGNRLTAFALRMAPLQVSWLDYFCTTAVPAMDVFLSDAVLTPERDDALFTERVVRLPAGRLCYAPATTAPAIVARAPGPVRFGSFNRLSKLNDEVAQAWSAILRAVPGSTLLLKGGGLGDEATRRLVLDRRFAAHGIDPERIRFEGYGAYAETLARYGEIDIALDPFPFSGCATTCDALWMGVPVITRPGDTLVSRQSASLLHAVGLSDLIASDVDDYVAIAVKHAGDEARRATWRETLRERARQGFGDATRFARDFEAAVRDALARVTK